MSGSKKALRAGWLAAVGVVLGAAAAGGEALQAGAARVLLIELETAPDGGVGCGDRLLAVPVAVQEGQDPLRVALVQLLEQGDELARDHGLYNSLSRSRLTLEELTVDRARADVHLSGSLQIGGECDIPRIRAQLERTALQFRQIRQVRFFVDGVPLLELLSLR